MTEQPTEEQATATEESPPPEPAPQATPQQESTYSADDLAAQAQALGCFPWDVPAIFKAKGVETMTLPEFEAALEEWRTPIPPPEPEGEAQSEGSF